MATEDFKRKLTAILSADVEGYSRLMREDEEATVSTITTYRSAMATLIQQYRGRVVDSPGDNILAEFTSVVDAVNCAVEIQRELAERNAELPVERKMEFRIGVNLGDVIEEGERIYGDGVNIAARVEGLADGGGICISGTVYDAIEAKLGLEYEYLGEQAVKNIPKAMRVYRVLSFPGAAAHRVIEAKKAVGRTWRNVFLAIAAILVVGAAAIATWKFYLRPAPPIEVASVEKMAFPLPDKPSIAVLPFDNLSEDPKQEYFGDGLTDEIIAVLSKVPKLFVIARNSTFTYKGKPVKVQQVSEELGVRYVLEGSVKQAAEKIRITAQLIDALSGHHLWAELYDRNLSDIFAVQDEITKEIITAMQVKLTEGEQARAVAKGTNNLQAYLKYLQANEYYHRLNIESNNLARQLAGEAIALDPEYAMAYGVLAKTHLFDFWLDTSTSQEQSLAEATELLQKAIVLDDTYAEAYGLLGFVFSMRRQPDEALAQAEKAVALNPNAAESHFLLGMVITLCCKEEEAIPEYKKAIRLNPIPPNIYLWSLGLAYAETGQYDEAITWCEKAVRQQPDDLLARIMMTAAYSWSGRDEEARAEAAEVLRINPKFSLERFAKRAGTGLVSELRKAGLK
jgi:TolB-like protein/class 3 adenylate cyclase/cytochrome c-type biogenesis protein CcmH/NrfG